MPLRATILNENDTEPLLTLDFELEAAISLENGMTSQDELLNISVQF